MATEVRMYFNNQPADEAVIDLFGEIRVDQAIGLVTEASLEIDLALDEGGTWSDIEEDYTQPGARVRVEAKVGEGDFVPLIEGTVVGQRFELNAEPNASKLVLIVHDDSVLLSREEKVEVFEDKTASEVATQLFGEVGLEAEVDDVAAAGSALERAIVQRGSALQLLRVLAKRHGMHVYVKPGAAPGSSIGVFAQVDLSPADLPELLLMGSERNVNRLEIEFDGLRPTTARAGSVTVSDVAAQSASATASSQRTLGDVPAHDVIEPATLLLSRTREEAADLEAAVLASVDSSSWAYSAHGEVDAEAYRAVLTPYRVVSVAGAGRLSGEYLVSKVVHVLNDEGYRQEFGLRRNAHSTTDSGGLPGGVF